MIQKQDDKKPEYKPFKLRVEMTELDNYLRVFILPQIPAGFAEYRDSVRATMDKAWRELFRAAGTRKRVRQNHLVELKVELSMLDVYLQGIREVCYRGKEKKRLDKNSERRFEVCATKMHKVMNLVWAWAKNEDKKMDTEKSDKTVGLIEKEEM